SLGITTCELKAEIA
ncbi:hypothetical protein VCHC37A1_1511B, partial [Vibrio cholerae HC-37A1]